MFSDSATKNNDDRSTTDDKIHINDDKIIDTPPDKDDEVEKANRYRDERFIYFWSKMGYDINSIITIDNLY